MPPCCSRGALWRRKREPGRLTRLPVHPAKAIGGGVGSTWCARGSRCLAAPRDGCSIWEHGRKAETAALHCNAGGAWALGALEPPTRHIYIPQAWQLLRQPAQAAVAHAAAARQPQALQGAALRGDEFRQLIHAAGARQIQRLQLAQADGSQRPQGLCRGFWRPVTLLRWFLWGRAEGAAGARGLRQHAEQQWRRRWGRIGAAGAATAAAGGEVNQHAVRRAIRKHVAVRRQLPLDLLGSTGKGGQYR